MFDCGGRADGSGGRRLPGAAVEIDVSDAGDTVRLDA